MFLLPSLIPKTLEDLASKPDQAALLAKREAELKEKVSTSGSPSLQCPSSILDLLNPRRCICTLCVISTPVNTASCSTYELCIELASEPFSASLSTLHSVCMQWQTIRDYKRGETPLGVPQQNQTEEEEEDDDDGDDEMTEEEEVLCTPSPDRPSIMAHLFSCTPLRCSPSS